MPQTTRTSRRHQIARDLLRIGAVRLAPEDPFTWTSGRRAPIYCDNRLTLAYPDVRLRIAEGFADKISRHGLQPDLIAGTATAGIPHAAWLADRLDLPMVYVRSQAKEHGRGQHIEGRLQDRERVVLVEDLISTGGSAYEAAQALSDEAADVLIVLAIFSYGLQASSDRFADAPFPLSALTDFDALLQAARSTNTLEEEAVQTLQRWREDPQAWSKQHGGTY